MSTEVNSAHAALENPWPGLAPYTEQQSSQFFGREAEIEELLRLIQRDTLTILFGRSGLGKSSLLHAGVIPRLRTGLYFPVLVRLNFADLEVDTVAQVKSITLAAARKHGLATDSRIAGNATATATLWEFFHGTDFWGPRNDQLTPLLIFDQFEEAFTIGKDQSQASDFLEQLADLAQNRLPLVVEQRIKESAERVEIDMGGPNYKIVLSLREDFVSRLDQLRPILPAIMRNRMGLLPLDGTRALEVIVSSGKPWVNEAVAQDIVAALAGETGAAGSAIAHAEIEPAYLSVMCHELFRRMADLGLESITSELVTKEHGEILEAMYERSFEGLTPSVRIFVEDRLLTASGFRGTLPLSEALAEGVSLRDLETLVDRRLLRFEDRLGMRHVELSHDLLTGVVRKSRELRAARAAQAEEERKHQELRRALMHARRRTAIAAAIAVIALGGVAYSVSYWHAYIHPTSAYYMSYTDQLGRVVPFGQINEEAVHHRAVSFKVTRQGSKGEILSVEAVDSLGNPSMQNSLGTALTSDESSSDQDAYCRLEFQYDKSGRMEHETAWNKSHRLIWDATYVYVFLQGQGYSQTARNAIYFGFGALPYPPRPGYQAEILHIEDTSPGHQIRTWLTRDGQKALGNDNAYGQEFVYDAQGRVLSETSLDKDGHPTNDNAGNATELLEYEQQGNEKSGKAIDAKGNPTLWNGAGYSSRTLLYDPWGNVTEESYFDVDGSPMVSSGDGAHTIRVAYDDHGNRTDIAYFDLYGNPIDKSSSPSYQRVHMEYDKQNHVTREIFFNSGGLPAKGDDAVYDIRLSYDAKGNISEVDYFDDKGKPMNNDSGFQLIRRQYDDSGRLLEESYFGTDSQPVDAGSGNQKVNMHYDSHGRRDSWNYFDKTGSPPKKLGYSQLDVTYDRWGNAIEWKYARTQPSSLTYDISRASYNASAGPVETCYFNSDGSKAAASDGISCTTAKYDDRGLEIEEDHLDKNGKLQADSDGIARSEYSYNDKRQMTRQEYFGVSGPAKRAKDAPYLIETEYDAAGHKTEVKSVDVAGDAAIDQYDLQGHLTEESYLNPRGGLMTMKGDTYARTLYERTDQGRTLLIRYLGADGKPVVPKDGCATERQDFDAKGKLLKAACFDANGQPMDSKSTLGVALLTWVRNANENPTEKEGFGPDGKPALTTEGYARIKWQYDAAGKRTQTQEWMPSGESTVMQFDADGNETEESYYDAVGKREIKPGDTFAIVRYERTDQGQKLVTRYLGTDEKPVAGKDACATESEDFDAKGKLLKDACFDANGQPMESDSTLGAAVLTYVRDANGDITEFEAFGPDGRPAETTEGFAHLKVTEDSTGNPTQKDYFDQNGVLVLRWTPEETCNIDQAGKDLAKADCIITDASRAFLRSGQKKTVIVVSSVSTDDKDKGTALKAQIHVGDVLLENDGVSSYQELWQRFTSGPDRPRSLILLRNGKLLNVQIPKGAFGAGVGLTLSSE
jgi:hypothetical protein